MKKYSNKGDKPTKTGFGLGVLEAAKQNKKVLGIGVDITQSVGMDLFANAFPERFLSMGVAEQNAVGISAGLALSGKTPVFATYGVFSAMRTTDFIRISICYNNLHVVIGGAHAGISVGPDGATHQAMEDIAMMRVIPNMTVLSPADATQARWLTEYAINHLKGPVYIRFGRAPVPDFTKDLSISDLEKGQLLKTGNDIAIVATGHMVWEALQAAYALSEEGIDARVINIFSIKPIDKEILIKAARETKKIITVEEHQVMGGFGSAVAEVISQNHAVPIKMIGMNDRFGESGQPMELMKKFGMNADNIFHETLKFLQQ